MTEQDKGGDAVSEAMAAIMRQPGLGGETLEAREKELATLARALRARREVAALQQENEDDALADGAVEQRLRRELFDRLAARARSLGLAAADRGAGSD